MQSIATRTNEETHFSGDAPLDPRAFTPAEFYTHALTCGISNESARRWSSAVIGGGIYDKEIIRAEAQIPKRLAHHIASPQSLTLHRHVRSSVDGFEKLVFKTHDDLAIETVLIPLHKKGAVSVCVSSQIGCVMDCAFCATARMKTRRNLHSWEILDQLMHARSIATLQNRTITGAVFMGMGEPFLNFAHVIKAADWMRQPLKNAISGKAITISTVGIVPKIRTFTDMNLPFRLSISLGASNDEKRARLVPVAARHSIREIMSEARRYTEIQKRRINLSYVCISGENVGEQDAQELGELIGTIPVRIDLIDVTDATGRFSPPTPNELQVFRDALAHYVKQPIARRYSGGADIAASCGTLAGAT